VHTGNAAYSGKIPQSLVSHEGEQFVAGSRSFKIALILSCLLHLGAFVALDQEAVSLKMLAPPPPTVALKKSKPQSVQFELVDTPPSARAATPPEKTNLMSDKNTRAQDRFEGKEKLKNAPHMEGKNDKAKDTRPKMTAPQPPKRGAEPTPPAPPQEDVKPEPKPEPVEKKEEPPQKAKEAEAVALLKPEPKPQQKDEPALEMPKKEVLQLAKKTPDVQPPDLTAPQFISPGVSPASARNTDADAELTGELSYAASRHFFGEYLLKMKEAVERQWVSRLVSKYTGIVSSQAVIDFKIQPDGSVADLSVETSEGDPYFPVVCVSSINDAQPFGNIPYEQASGLPEKYMNKPLNIRFTFRYN
jgi:outer membrane biosynthesis protein TonB